MMKSALHLGVTHARPKHLTINFKTLTIPIISPGHQALPPNILIQAIARYSIHWALQMVYTQGLTTQGTQLHQDSMYVALSRPAP